jgi:hypothetical protein
MIDEVGLIPYFSGASNGTALSISVTTGKIVAVTILLACNVAVRKMEPAEIKFVCVTLLNDEFAISRANRFRVPNVKTELQPIFEVA